MKSKRDKRKEVRGCSGSIMLKEILCLAHALFSWFTIMLLYVTWMISMIYTRDGKSLEFWCFHDKTVCEMKFQILLVSMQITVLGAFLCFFYDSRLHIEFLYIPC